MLNQSGLIAFRQRFAEPGHGPVEMVELEGFDAARALVGAPRIVIVAMDEPHGPIAAALCRLGKHADTSISAFTNGDEMLRGYLVKAGISERSGLDWPHLARRVQVAKPTAKGLPAQTNREHRTRPAIRRLLDSLHCRL